MPEPTKKIYGPGLVARSVNERNLVEHIPRLGHSQDRHAVHSLMLASVRWFRVVRTGSFCAPVIERRRTGCGSNDGQQLPQPMRSDIRA